MSQSTVSFSLPTKILLPLDFSDSSNAALAAAIEFGECFHAEIELLHIIATTPDFNGSDFFPNTSRLKEAKSEVDAKLEASKSALQSKGIRTSSIVEISNDVAESIIKISQRDSANMIIISTHGMSGWRPLIFGTIAEKVLKLAQCPLLLLPTVKPVSADTDSIRSEDQKMSHSAASLKGAPRSGSDTTEVVEQHRLDRMAGEVSEVCQGRSKTPTSAAE